MNTTDFSNKAKQLIDDLKGICASAGLGGDANEYKIVTQCFLYKFLNDKFVHEAIKINSNYMGYESLSKISESDYKMLLVRLGTKTAQLNPEHLLEYLFKHQNDPDFAKLFENTLNDIAIQNSSIFSVHTAGDTEIRLFEENLISSAVHDRSKHDETARAIINKLADSKFELDELLNSGFDFFSTLFEYMIKDYNKDGGGKYAEYYTPHSIAKIMADILVGDETPSNVKVYDPAAGSGTLLMNLAHKIGQDRCSVYSQDMSQKSSNLLRLNLILNGLSHSIDHIVQGNTISEPHHITEKFDYIVSNPPFEPLMTKSEHDKILSLQGTLQARFIHGIPNLVKAKGGAQKTYIYLLFLQHIIFSLSNEGKAAIVVPVGFLTAGTKIEKSIKKMIIDSGWLKGVVTMPSNIFATTGTNVAVIFLDKLNSSKPTLVDASTLGTKVNLGDGQKTLLSKDEEQKIVEAFKSKVAIEDLSVIVNYDEIKEKNYSLSAGQYFDIKIEYTDITPEEFKAKMRGFEDRLEDFFRQSKNLEIAIQNNLQKIISKK